MITRQLDKHKKPATHRCLCIKPFREFKLMRIYSYCVIDSREQSPFVFIDQDSVLGVMCPMDIFSAHFQNIA